MNYGIRDLLLVESACPGTVHRVRGGDGARGHGSPYIDAEWEGNMQETELENHGPRWGYMHLQDGFSNRHGTLELTRLGVSGTGGNTDGNTGSFFSPEYPGHCHHIEGGKPPPFMVPPVQHAGVLESTEQEATLHRPVRQGGGYELPMDGGRGDVGERGESL